MSFLGWIARAATILTVLVAGSGIAGGYSGKREVNGQVFVVTQGGESVKLGLVGIHVVEERELSGIASQVQRQAATNRANRDLLEGLKKEIQDLVDKAPPDFASPLELIRLSVQERWWTELSKDSPEVTLFRVLPPAVTQTDADGLFVVQASETDWLAARSQRLAGNSKESYLWLMPFGGLKKKLLVSNDRMLKANELLPTLEGVSPVETNIKAESSLVTWASEQRQAGQIALAEARAANERATAEAKAQKKAKEQERRRLATVATQPQPERQPVQIQEAGGSPRKPINGLARAMEQMGIIDGKKMPQQGGTSRFSISPSFDGKSSPFGEYDQRMLAAVQERWWALLEERTYALERTGKVVLKFRLHADGSISQMTTAESTVGETLSFTCEAAVMGASPFGRWPSVLKAQALDPREITLTFHYY